jgi:hypothetical protein
LPRTGGQRRAADYSADARTSIRQRRVPAPIERDPLSLSNQLIDVPFADFQLPSSQGNRKKVYIEPLAPTYIASVNVSFSQRSADQCLSLEPRDLSIIVRSLTELTDEIRYRPNIISSAKILAQNYFTSCLNNCGLVVVPSLTAVIERGAKFVTQLVLAQKNRAHPSSDICPWRHRAG